MNHRATNQSNENFEELSRDPLNMQNFTLVCLPSQQQGSVTQESGNQYNTAEFNRNFNYSPDGPRIDVYGQTYASKNYLLTQNAGNPLNYGQRAATDENFANIVYAEDNEFIDSGAESIAEEKRAPVPRRQEMSPTKIRFKYSPPKQWSSPDSLNSDNVRLSVENSRREIDYLKQEFSFCMSAESPKNSSENYGNKLGRLPKEVVKVPAISSNNTINLSTKNKSPANSSNMMNPSTFSKRNSPEENYESHDTEEDPKIYNQSAKEIGQPSNVLNDLYDLKSHNYETLLKYFPELRLIGNASTESQVCFDCNQEPGHQLESTIKKPKDSDQLFANEHEVSSGGTPRHNIVIPSPQLTPQKNNLKTLDKKSGLIDHDSDNGNYSSLYHQGETFRNNFYEMYLEQCSRDHTSERVVQTERNSMSSEPLNKSAEEANQLEDNPKSRSGYQDEGSRIVQFHKFNKNLVSPEFQNKLIENVSNHFIINADRENLSKFSKNAASNKFENYEGNKADFRAIQEPLQVKNWSQKRLSQTKIPESAFLSSNRTSPQSDKPISQSPPRANNVVDKTFTPSFTGNMFTDQYATNKLSYRTTPEKDHDFQGKAVTNQSPFLRSNRSSPSRASQFNESAREKVIEKLGQSFENDYGIRHNPYTSEKLSSFRSSVKSSDQRDKSLDAKHSRQQSPEKSSTTIENHIINDKGSSIQEEKFAMPEISLKNIINEPKIQISEGNINQIVSSNHLTNGILGDRNHTQSDPALELDQYFKNILTLPKKNRVIEEEEALLSATYESSMRKNLDLDATRTISFEPMQINQVSQESKIHSIIENTSPQKIKNENCHEDYTHLSPQKKINASDSSADALAHPNSALSNTFAQKSDKIVGKPKIAGLSPNKLEPHQHDTANTLEHSDAEPEKFSPYIQQKDNISDPKNQSTHFKGDTEVLNRPPTKGNTSASNSRDWSYSPDSTSNRPVLKESTNKTSSYKISNSQSQRILNHSYSPSKLNMKDELPIHQSELRLLETKLQQPSASLENQISTLEGVFQSFSPTNATNYIRALQGFQTPPKKHKYSIPTPLKRTPETSESAQKQIANKFQPAYDYDRILSKKMPDKMEKNKDQISNPLRQPADNSGQTNETSSLLQPTKLPHSLKKINLSRTKVSLMNRKSGLGSNKSYNPLSRSPNDKNPLECQAVKLNDNANQSMHNQAENYSFEKIETEAHDQEKPSVQHRDTNSTTISNKMRNSNSIDNLSRDRSYRDILKKIYSLPISKPNNSTTKQRKNQPIKQTSTTIEDEFYKGFSQSKDYINRSSTGLSKNKPNTVVEQNNTKHHIQFGNAQEFSYYLPDSRVQTEPIADKYNERSPHDRNGTTVSEPIFAVGKDRRINTEASDEGFRGNLFLNLDAQHPSLSVSQSSNRVRGTKPQNISPEFPSKNVQMTKISPQTPRIEGKDTDEFRGGLQTDNIFLNSFELAKKAAHKNNARFFGDIRSTNVEKVLTKPGDQGKSISQRIAEEISKRSESRSEMTNKQFKGAKAIRNKPIFFK